MAGDNVIGEFLRARRELVRPEDAGLPDAGGRRRVPGLRRSEVALLAGVSTEYYVRLEQGRDQHPSEQVVDSLARALQLDEDATAHLHRLARPPARRRRAAARPEKVPDGILQLISCWHETPAYVQGRYMDVLAVNPLCRALAPCYEVGVNLVRAVFLDPRVQEHFGDWEDIIQSMAGKLRALVGPDVDDPRLTELVGELSVRSERFRRAWARHDVPPRRRGRAKIRHPVVGQLELRFEQLPVPGVDRQILIVYHAAPGSASAQGLALLASASAEAREPVRP